MDFLADDCGQNALQLASRGAAIIAELLRLSEHIPSVFREPERFPEYDVILNDYRYFTQQDVIERKIQASATLLEKDEEFQQTHVDLLDRFFRLFKAVYGYASELSRYIQDIKDGVFISQTIESILVNADGKQLLCEVFYLYGVMLLLLDYKVGGKAREHIVVSYVRYRGTGDSVTGDICEMCRNTGFQYGQPLPRNYPESYFKRVRIPLDIVSLLLGRLRSDDVYQMAFNYPAPEHRSTALSTQGAMIFVLLFFQTDILHHEKPVMREIVDKHFADNWVLNYYMGFTADLCVYWAPYKAALHAISGTVALDNVQYHHKRARARLVSLNVAVADFLKEGVLTEKYVLDNIQSTLLPTIRDANVTLRWFFLHMTRGPHGRRMQETFRKAYEHVSTGVTADDILTLLLQTAELEFELTTMFTKLLKEKRRKWEEAKEAGSVKMTKLATYFSGNDILSDNVRVAQLETWFTEIAQRIESLAYHDSTAASRKIQKLLGALEKVQEFHHIDSNIQVVQFITDTRALLRKMIRYINIEKKVIVTIATVGDLSYAWELVSRFNCFVPEMQNKIKCNPHLVKQMRSTFMKLATMLELPCTRIAQGAAHDVSLVESLESVSEYYSSELVTFVRKVLHIIPVSIFETLNDIIRVQGTLKELTENKIKKDGELKEFAQLEGRRTLARLTSDVSKFADGILAMEQTLMGVIQIDPHQLLEDGIRKELVRQITEELHNSLVFDTSKRIKPEEFDAQLRLVAKKMNGMRRSFEYIQDYVNVHGLRIWLEEFWRIVNFNVEMECNAFMKKKIYPWQSRFQSEAIPIPYHDKPSAFGGYSFLGRLTTHLVRLTNPKQSIFVPALGAWYDAAGQETCGPRILSGIYGALGSQGVNALDRLLCNIIARDIQVAISLVKKSIAGSGHIEQFFECLLPLGSAPVKAAKLYEEVSKVFAKPMSELVDIATRIGRSQLLRRALGAQLRTNCKLNSGQLYCTVKTANDAVLGDIRRHYSNPEETPMPGSIVAELAPFLQSTGMADPLSKIYVTSAPLPKLPAVLAATTVKLLSRVVYDAKLDTMISRKKDDAYDFFSFTVGVQTLLHQFHANCKDIYFSLLTQYVRTILWDFENEERKVRERDIVPSIALSVLHHVEQLGSVSETHVKAIEKALPKHLLASYRTLRAI